VQTAQRGEGSVEELDIICERLLAAAVEATMIVVESKLHGDPLPSLRGHYRAIARGRESLYRSYRGVASSHLDGLLRERGLAALRDEYRGDSRNGDEELRSTFIEVLFHTPSFDYAFGAEAE
jgi:hypothetical protein